MITDRFDGALARSYGIETDFGRLADPIADKTLIGAALIGLAMLGELPWWVTVVILVREIGITVLRFAVLRHGVIPASRGGKLKTLVQAVAIGLFILPLSGPWLTGAWVVMAAAIVLTVLTGVDYVVSAIRDSGVDPQVSDPSAEELRQLRPSGNHPGSRWRCCSTTQVKESTMGTLLREVIGDVLRRARIDQGRTLREVSDAARVSLGYLSEVERGRKEASSELLSAICGALDVPLSQGAVRRRRRDGAEERKAFARDSVSAANIDATTKVVIPHAVSMASPSCSDLRETDKLAVGTRKQSRHEGGMNPWPIRSPRRGAT